MIKSALRFYQRRRFAILFFSILVALGFAPIVESFRWGAFIIELVMATSLLAVIASLERRRITLILALFIVLAAARVFRELIQSSTTHHISDGMWVVCGVLALFVCARYALREGSIDAERLFSALSTYLLAALVMAASYWTLESALPGSFTIAGGKPFDMDTAVYFSFVTISTLGYGDVVPVSEAARGLSVLEAVGGQMYLAVLVARLVSLYTVHAPRKR
ncbi:MAG TPA: ion channel [Candidatus Krumholzibacteria bacterium]|nr:ion channel [Candidatus Krumholzibacteria bacterium]